MKDIQESIEMLKSDDEESRLQGLKRLASCGAESSLNLIYEALGDASWRVRKQATELFISLSSDGKFVGDIIKLLYSQENAGQRNAALEILTRLGRHSIPFLFDELSSDDPDVRKFVIDVLGDIGGESCLEPLLKALEDPDNNVRGAAAEALGKIGAPRAVPALLDALEHSDRFFRFVVLEALGQIGEVVPVERLLKFKSDKLLRKALFDCLGLVGGAKAIPALIEGLADNMRNVRDAAAVALARIGDVSPSEVTDALCKGDVCHLADSLESLLQDRNLIVKQAAIKLISLSGDKRFVFKLLELFDDEDVRETAAAALISLGHEAGCSLIELWPDADNRRRTYLAYIFGEVKCTEGMNLLLVGLASGDPELQVICCQALGKLGDIEALSHLIPYLEIGSEDVREAAMHAIYRLGAACPETAVKVLHPLLEYDDPNLRMYVVMILGRLPDPEVHDYLAFAIKDESPLVRRAAVRAMEGHTGDFLLESFILALTDEDSEVRKLAAESLGMTGEREALQPLALALQDEDMWVRAAAVRAIGHIGGGEADELIKSALHDPVGLVHIAALEALSDIDIEKAFPFLLEALSSDDEEVVALAFQLLSAANRTDWIDPVMDQLINHPQWKVRIAFARVLAETGGEKYRHALESRLEIEDEDLVSQQIKDLLNYLEDKQD